MNTDRPPFCWSPERHRTFHTCLRRYYYRYYAFEEGRRSDASARAREIYFLGDLQSRRPWAQRHLARAAAELARQGQPGPLPDSGMAAAQLLETMREDFRASRRGGYRLTPKQTDGLFEHAYEIQVPDEQWKALADETAAQLEAFCRSDYFQGLSRVAPADRLIVGEVAEYILQGLPVTLRVPLAARDGAAVQVHDWRLESLDAGTQTLARAARAGLAAAVWSAPPGQITILEYDFPAGPAREYQPDADALAAGTELLHDAADEMRFPLADPEHNVAREEDFDCVEDDRVCHVCPFLRVCPKWTC